MQPRRRMTLLFVLVSACAAALSSSKPPRHSSRGGGQRRLASRDTTAPLVVENDVTALNGFGDGGALQLTYATDAACVTSWLRACADEHTLGFDTETRPAFRKGEIYAPATLQLSTASACLVVHLTHLDAMPDALVETLADESVLKVGVGVDDDSIELWLHHGLDVNGRLDMATIGAGSARSLGGLCTEILGVTLDKSNALKLTNWSRRALTVPEVRYAALDAWAGRALHDEVARRRRGGGSVGADGDADGVSGAEGGGGDGGASLASLVATEYSCSELYAYRRVRQAMKASFIALDMEFSESGLPHRRQAMSAEGRRDAKRVMRTVDKSRKAVAKLFSVRGRAGTAPPLAPAAADAAAAASPGAARDAARAKAAEEEDARKLDEARARTATLERARERDAAEARAREEGQRQKEEERARRRKERKEEREQQEREAGG